MVEKVTLYLRQGHRTWIAGLGTLEVRKREARTGRNPGRRGDPDRCQQEGRLPVAQELKETVQV